MPLPQRAAEPSVAPTAPPPPLVLMENHDESLEVWRREGVADRVLIHVDAHHDMYWTEGPEPPTIANYICRALQEGRAREVHWVIPDPSWDRPGGRRLLMRHLKGLLRQYPGRRCSLRPEADRIGATVLGRPFFVAPLRHLPSFAEPVLLDVDTDFFLFPDMASDAYDRHSPLPWCWPQDLVERLQDARVTSRCTTIAYSVEGGFTPLRWKYLGDDLALRLSPAKTDSVLAGLDLLRDGAEAVARDDRPAAEAAYRRARDLLPRLAAPDFHLALLYGAAGRPDEARAAYHRAVALDPTYRTPYSSRGLWCEQAGWLDEAESEHRLMLRVAPDDPWAYFGLGRVEVERGRWAAAEEWLARAVAVDPDCMEAHRALGQVFDRLHRVEEAIAAYERSLILALKGHKPLHEPIETLGPEAVRDRDHGRIHALLARLYERCGRTPEAVQGYRLAVASGYDRPWVRGRLAWLYLREGRPPVAGIELWRGACLLPLATRRTWARTRRRFLDSLGVRR